MDEELKKIEKDKIKAVNLGKYKEAADFSNYIGCQLFAKGEYEDALSYHLEELELNQKVNDNLGIAVANRRLGECYAELGNFKKAFSHIKTYLDISVSLKNKVEEQRSWATLGRTFYLKYTKLKDDNSNDNTNSKVLDQAEKSYFKALELCEYAKTYLTDKEYAEMKARCLLNLGLVCECRESISDCASYIARAIALATKFNLYEDLYRCQSFLSSMYLKHKQFKDALKSIDCAIDSVKKLNDKTLLVEELISKAGVLIFLKDFLGAKSCLVTAYRVDAPVEANHDKLNKLLKIYVGLCNSQKKLEELHSSNNDERKLIFEKMADALAYLENYELALEYYFKSLKCIENIDSATFQKGPIYFSIGMTYKDIGEHSKALEYLSKEMNCYADKPIEQIKSLMNLGEVYEEMGDINKGETNFMKAVNVAQSTSNKKLLKSSLFKLMDFYERNQMTENAEKVKSKLESNTFQDLSSDESEEESQDPYGDICLEELPELKSTESNSSVRRRTYTKKAFFKVNEKGETPLHKACIEKKFAAVKKLIESGHEVNVRDNCGWTPLHEAVNHDAIEIVEYLLDHGADINDRGGEDCDGITPLHDAAVCGHIHIMQLLISRGASVTAVDDLGCTPLERLLEKKREDQNFLTVEELKQYEEMEDELRRKMAEAGQPAKDTAPQKENLNDFAFLINTDFPDYYSDDCDSVRPSEKRARSSSSSSEQDSDNIENSSPPYKNDQGNGWGDAKKAKLEYKSVMSNLRRSAKSVNPEPHLPSKPDSIPALIEENKIVDEWLIKDVGPVPPMKKKRRKMSRLQVRTSKSLYNYMSPQNDSASEDMESINEDVNSNDSSNNIDRDSITPTNIQESKTFKTNKREPSKLSFCIKVKITDKLILVPVPEDSCTIGWLADQAAQRYQDLLGSRPYLTLMTTDGAFLSKTDIIKNLFDNNEEIASTVEFWDEPSLNERYIQNCEKRGVKPIPSIQKRFLDFETSPELNFSNSSIPNPQLMLIFSTLKHVQNLQHFDISSTMITDTIASEIISCFPSFSSLVSLNMSCCCLTADTVKNISDYLLEQTSFKTRLPNLKTLIMNNNVFHGHCDKHFNAILQLSSLRILSLYSCNLVPSFFENKELCQNLQNSSLEEFNVAGNTFNERSINNLLSSLPKKSLKKLDLSHTVNNKNLSFIQNLCGFLTFTPVLQEIHLADCNLKDEHLYLLSQSNFCCSQLRSFNLSSNMNLSCSAILDFLKSILHNNKSLIDILMTGTCSWDLRSTETLIDILSSSNVNNLMLDNISQSCQEKLVEFWKNYWGKKASCLNALFCKLSVL